MVDNLSATIAERWHEDWLAAIGSSKSFPNRSTLALEAQEFQREVRQLRVCKVKNYRALFAVEVEKVFVLYVILAALC